MLLLFFRTACRPHPQALITQPTKAHLLCCSVELSHLSCFPNTLSETSMLLFSIYHWLQREKNASSPPGFCITNHPTVTRSYLSELTSLPQTYFRASPVFYPQTQHWGMPLRNQLHSVRGSEEGWQKRERESSLPLYSSAWGTGIGKPAHIYPMPCLTSGLWGQAPFCKIIGKDE